jgi:diaminohydroxyphosphoribosylaminopyrimidine deaminase / 5-amino-6-(5-phosphoribosylamino)uracil reductase
MVRRPPCTDALRRAGVARVVFGARDPGGESGGGAEELRRHGLEVAGPLLSPQEARRENPAFFHGAAHRPWTVLKLALSLDGGIAPAPGVRMQLTGPEAAAAVHRLRAGVDGILVGTRTARVDDPLLTVRGDVVPRVPPARILLDLEGRLGPDLRALREGEAPVWILTGPGSPAEWRREMEAAGARVLVVEGRDAEGSRSAGGGAGGGDVPARPDPSDLLGALRAEGVRSLLCEGGGRWGAALLHDGLVDRLVHVVAPTVLGPGAVPGHPVGASSPGGQGRGGAKGRPPGDRWIPGPVRLLGDDRWLEWDRLPPGEMGAGHSIFPGEG